jgi:hypothetical protein
MEEIGAFKEEEVASAAMGVTPDHELEPGLGVGGAPGIRGGELRDGQTITDPLSIIYGLTCKSRKDSFKGEKELITRLPKPM